METEDLVGGLDEEEMESGIRSLTRSQAALAGDLASADDGDGGGGGGGGV